MHKLLIAAVVAALAGSTAKADWNTPPRPAPDAGCPDGGCTHKQYGLNPLLKKMLWWKKDDGCATCGKAGLGGKLAGCIGPNCAGQGAAAPPPFMGGTLVFPNHQFARSPRDYFMYGQGGN